jgi:hypothetical protein
LNDIIQKPEIVSNSDYLAAINEQIFFRPLLFTDEKHLTIFLESLYECTRHYCVYPSSDEKTTGLFL